MNHLPSLPDGRGEYVPNHLAWAILSTVFCCLPLGIVSIVYASQVDGKRAAGDMAGARETSAKARFWALLSTALALVPIGLYLLFLIAFGGLAMLGGLGAVN